MIFQNPRWLFGALLVVIVFFAAWWDLRRRKKVFSGIIDPALWSKVTPEWDPGLVLRKSWVWSLALIFVFVAMARPQWGKKEETVKTTGVDIMVVMDVSRSMLVEDEVPSRLKKAKHAIRSLMAGLKGDRLGLIAFAGSAFVASPLTTDLSYVGETLDVLEPQMVVNQGTDLAIALETAVKTMDRGAESGKASKAVILVSDGEDHSEKDLKLAKLLPDSGIKLYVIGVGTEKGGPIPVRDESGRLVGYKRDQKGQSVVSTFHPESLKKIAASASGVFFRATPSENEVEEILKDLGNMNPDGMTERKIVTFHERYQIFLTIAVILILLEMALPAHRRKVLMVTQGILLVTVVLLVGARPVFAASVGAYMESEKGIKSYEAGDYEGAKNHFEAAKEKDPKNPLTDFNQGTVFSKQENVDSAVETFGQAAQKAKELQNESLAGRSFFNQGNSLVKKKDTQAAIQSYLNAIDSAKKSQDSELEQMARKNIEILNQKQKQEQQKKKDKQEKNEDKKDDQDQDKKQDKDKEQEKNQNQDQNGQKPPQESKKDKKDGQDNVKKKQEFKSESLSKEDADRVMQELSSQQKELQTRLKKQKGQPMNKEKDW